jgi:acyl carrier protein
MSWFRRKQPAEAAPQPPAPAAPSPTPAGPSDAVLDSLRECVVKLSDGKLTAAAIDPTAHIFDFGYVDSFKSAELLTFVEKQYGVNIPEVQLVGALCTLEAIARHVQSKRAG